MPDFNVRSDSVNVEQIMEQIRSRIRERRGVDYTEQQIRELAEVKLEKFLDPRGVRSDLLEQFRQVQRAHEPPAPPNYAFETETIFETHRGLLRWIRGLLRPLLKLFFNPNPMIQALHIQSQLNTLNAERETSRRAMDQLHYEVMHNLVLEITRMSIEVKNLKMRVESVSSRLEFNERRARALESVVAYKESADTFVEREPDAPAPPAVAAPPQPPHPSTPLVAPPGPVVSGQPAEGPGQRSRRRRRRRGRRSTGPAAIVMGGQTAPPESEGAESEGTEPEGSEPEAESADHSVGAEPAASAPVAREDLEQFSGAESHPSEPLATERKPLDGGSDHGGSDPDSQ
jgi:hypothetical protein